MAPIGGYARPAKTLLSKLDTTTGRIATALDTVFYTWDALSDCHQNRTALCHGWHEKRSDGELFRPLPQSPSERPLDIGLEIPS